MQITVSGQHFEVTPALHQYAVEKLDRLNHHIDHINDIHVVLSVEKLRHRAMGNVQVKGAVLHATAESEDMYAAIDALGDKLHAQAIKYKEKKKDHSGAGLINEDETGAEDYLS